MGYKEEDADGNVIIDERTRFNFEEGCGTDELVDNGTWENFIGEDNPGDLAVAAVENYLTLRFDIEPC